MLQPMAPMPTVWVLSASGTLDAITGGRQTEKHILVIKVYYIAWLYFTRASLASLVVALWRLNKSTSHCFICSRLTLNVTIYAVFLNGILRNNYEPKNVTLDKIHHKETICMITMEVR
jgi:hypothetical protein